MKLNRLETLEYLKNHDKTIVVTNLMGYLRFLPSYEKSQNLKVSLKKGLTIDRAKIVNELEEYGYVRTSLVTSTGEYALRGFIIDIFPIEADHPIRIELFGEEVEAIRVFNEETQLSINEISKIDILPIQELNFDEHSSLFEYMHIQDTDERERWLELLFDSLFTIEKSEKINLHITNDQRQHFKWVPAIL